MQPTIINPESRFVVVTYWWGRGNLNRNMQRPCPEDVKSSHEPLQVEPITYDEMIGRWTMLCAQHGCNYMAVEKPEFAQKGMYQKAINYKPMFIREALEACAPRGVLYIDGDMYLRRYPAIFDLPDVDYMGRGWNMDTRETLKGPKDKANLCYDPYVLETSGGTFFLGQTPRAYKMLEDWYRDSARQSSKADDRIFSQTFNRNSELLHSNIIQLPVEYLWLSMKYDNTVHKALVRRRDIVIEHPECLTGEERALTEASASATRPKDTVNRIPMGYERHVTNKVECKRVKRDIFYEYVFFPRREYVKTLGPWLKGQQTLKLASVVPYAKKYGRFNHVADKNVQLMERVEPLPQTQFKDVMVLNTSEFEEARMVVPTVLKLLQAGINVVLCQKPTDARSLDRLVRHAQQKHASFVARNTNKNNARYKRDYLLMLDPRHPVYLGADSNILQHMLMMSSSLLDAADHFNSSYVFLSRIRCLWV